MLRRLRQAPEKLFLGRVKPALKFAERTAQCDLPVHFAGVVNEYFDPVPDAKQSESDPEKVEARSKKSPRRQNSRTNNLDGALAPGRRRLNLSAKRGNVSLKGPDVIDKLAIR